MREKILLPYQRGWLLDRSRFKIALKARQIGFSFIIALEGLLEAIEKKQNIIYLSASERQSNELLEKVIMHARALGHGAGEAIVSQNRSECKLENGSKILSLPANPDTVRGFTGSVFLDEFAFHRDGPRIFQAIMPTVTRDENRLRIVSTPAGDQGMFYRLWTADNEFSKHQVDIYQAISEGLKIDLDTLRRVTPDPDTFAQEFACKFLSDRESYFSLPLIYSCVEEEGETADWGGKVYMGVDVGRKRDRTVLITLHKVGDVLYARPIEVLEKATFQAQEDYISGCIERLAPHRLCIDATGMGMQLAENLSRRFPCVEGVTFTNLLKETVSVTCRRFMEKRQIRIPDDRDLISDIHRIKKIITAAGNIRYDTDRNASGHADRYWALALAVHAVSKKSSPAVEMGRDPEDDSSRRGFPNLQSWYV